MFSGGEEDDKFQKEKPKRGHDKYDIAGFNAKDQGLGEGIIRDRKITDLLCLLIFFAFIIAMGVATGYALKHGRVEKLMAPLDGDDHFCGIPSD